MSTHNYETAVVDTVLDLIRGYECSVRTNTRTGEISIHGPEGKGCCPIGFNYGDRSYLSIHIGEAGWDEGFIGDDASVDDRKAIVHGLLIQVLEGAVIETLRRHDGQVVHSQVALQRSHQTFSGGTGIWRPGPTEVIQYLPYPRVDNHSEDGQ